MTEEEFKISVTTPKVFKDEKEEKEHLFKVFKYWLKEYSPAIHLSQALPNGKIMEIGWLKDSLLIEGGERELELLRYVFENIKKSSIFAD